MSNRRYHLPGVAAVFAKRRWRKPLGVKNRRFCDILSFIVAKGDVGLTNRKGCGMVFSMNSSPSFPARPAPLEGQSPCLIFPGMDKAAQPTARFAVFKTKNLLTGKPHTGVVFHPLIYNFTSFFRIGT